MSNPELNRSLVFAGGPLILTSAQVGAETGSECQNRAAGAPRRCTLANSLISRCRSMPAYQIDLIEGDDDLEGNQRHDDDFQAQ